MIFDDRADAGRRLAQRLAHLRAEDPVVVGLPRGGVPVAFEVAQALEAPLDVIIVRKLGVPYQPEFAMGAVGDGGVLVVNEAVVRQVGVQREEFLVVAAQERAEVQRRAHRYRGDRPATPLAGRTVVVVDDGIATGATARAACRVARASGAARVVLAVPVAPMDWLATIGPDADEMIALHSPPHLHTVGQYYVNFLQTSDEEVIDCLERAGSRNLPQGTRALPTPVDRPGREQEVEVRAGQLRLAGHLSLPENSSGLVVFAHGSGSSRRSPRNRFVAEALGRAGLASLLVDLLTEDEELDRRNVFDVQLLGERLAETTRWLRSIPATSALSIGYFGASTGAAAAFWAAAEADTRVGAVVSRGGRPDLAAERLAAVTAATLLIVGGRDEAVIDLNRAAQQRLSCENELVVVPGATHLFVEPGALETVAELAANWFIQHLGPPGGSRTVDDAASRRRHGPP